MDKLAQSNGDYGFAQELPILGLIGGMAPESTAIYYRAITAAVSAHLGEHEAPELLLHSLNFGALYRSVSSGDSQSAIETISKAALGLTTLGAGLLAICSNTGHLAASLIATKTSVPLVHIGDAIAQEIRASCSTTALLLGTSAMASAHYISARLEDRGIVVSFPAQATQEQLDAIIFGELAKGVISDGGVAQITEIVTEAGRRGTQTIVLACTELSLVADKLSMQTHIVDSTQAHVRTIIATLLAHTGEPIHA